MFTDLWFYLCTKKECYYCKIPTIFANKHYGCYDMIDGYPKLICKKCKSKYCK